MISPLFLVIFAVVLLSCFMVFFGAPYVPSHKKYVRRAFDHFGIGGRDVLVDIGSGDGIILRIASRYGARAVGYEINPVLVFISRVLSVGDRRVRVYLQNAWRARLPDDVTFIYAFAVSRDEKKLTKLVQREASRMGRPLKLLCYGSPFKSTQVTETFEAYHLYIFHPLQPKKLKV